MTKKLTYPKEEKLKSRKMIGQIFTDGHVVKAYPVRIQFTFHDQDGPVCQVGVSVSKRNFKSAVDRNKIKRQLRESYRLNKEKINEKLAKHGKKIAMMIIYSSNESPKFDELERLVVKAMERIRI